MSPSREERRGEGEQGEGPASALPATPGPPPAPFFSRSFVPTMDYEIGDGIWPVNRNRTSEEGETSREWGTAAFLPLSSSHLFSSPLPLQSS